MNAFQTALQLIYPPRCTICGDQVSSDFGLCGACWRDTPFISGLCCDTCGAPLPGADHGDREICDDCLKIARPWSRGRAAIIYKDNGRKLVLALKHGDRHDIARPAALWLENAARPILKENMLVAPVPLHWTRLMRRKFNQSALLAQVFARQAGLGHCPDLLQRRVKTRPLEGVGFDARFAALQDAIEPHPKRRHRLSGQSILLIDDVMTSGATLSAATRACLKGGAKDVRILVLARVVKDA